MAPSPGPEFLCQVVSGRYEYRLIKGGVGHDLPREKPPQAFAGNNHLRCLGVSGASVRPAHRDKGRPKRKPSPGASSWHSSPSIGPRTLFSFATSPIAVRGANASAAHTRATSMIASGEGLWGFLRQIVPDAALDDPVLIFAGELLGIGAGLRVRRAIGVALHRDRRHGDSGAAASRFSISSYFASPSARLSRQR